MGSMLDAIVDITIVYPTGPTKFWDMMCGEFDQVIVDIAKRPVDDWIIAGDYQNDREFRTKFHKWLTQVWQEKDEQIRTLSRGAS
jgi:hypothetical protein